MLPSCFRISVRPAGRPTAECLYMAQNFNVVIFLDTIKMINVKLCMMLVHFKLYLRIPLSVTLIVSQSHSNTKQFNWKFCVLIRLSRHFVRLLIRSSRSWIYQHFFLFYFFWGGRVQGSHWLISSFENKLTLSFSRTLLGQVLSNFAWL